MQIRSSKGQSLIEIVFAIALFTVGVVTIGYFVFDAFKAAQYSDEYTQARLLAVEGIEAVRTIQTRDFTELNTGNHGIELVDGVWSLASSSDVTGAFTRTISIRDIDSDLKEVVSRITWEEAASRTEKSVELTTRLANWLQNGGERGYIEFRTEYADYTASGTELTGVEVSNNGTVSISITSMLVAWEGSALLTSIALDGVELLSTSSSPVASGTVVNIDDYTLNPYSGFRLFDHLRFTEDMGNSPVLITLVLGSGEHKYVHVVP